MPPTVEDMALVPTELAAIPSGGALRPSLLRAAGRRGRAGGSGPGRSGLCRLLQRVGAPHGRRRAAADPRSEPRSHGAHRAEGARGWPASSSPTPTAPRRTGCALKPLDDAFGVSTVSVVSMQALSGAGYPGVASLDIVDNVIPYIGGEEPKVRDRAAQAAGDLAGDHHHAWPAFTVSAQRNRVAVRNGHLEAVSVRAWAQGHGRGSRCRIHRLSRRAAAPRPAQRARSGHHPAHGRRPATTPP